MSKNLLDFPRLSSFVNGLVDRKIRPIAMSVTSSTGFLKMLVTQSAANAASAQTSANSAVIAANTSSANAASTTAIWNSFTSEYLGVQSADPTLSSLGNPINNGAFYVRASDNHLRTASVVNGVATWSDAVVIPDSSYLISAPNLIADMEAWTYVSGAIYQYDPDWGYIGQVQNPTNSEQEYCLYRASMAPNTQYVFSADLRALSPNTTGYAWIDIIYYNGAGNQISVSPRRSISGGTDFSDYRPRNTFQMVDVTPPNTASGVLRFCGNSQGAIAYAAIRKPKLEQHSTATLYSIEGDVAYTRGLIGAETARAEAAEANLQTGLTNEGNARVNQDNVLQNNISQEVNRAEAAEANLQAEITNNVNNLQNNINVETNRAESAESNLQTGVTNAQNQANNAVNLANNAQATANDAENRLNNEINRAEAAEANLQTGITNTSNYAQAVQQNVVNETNRAQAAEANAQNTANTANGNLAAFEGLFTTGSNANGSYETRPNVLSMWGQIFSSSSSEIVVTVTFPTPMASNNYSATATPFINAATGSADTWLQIIESSKTTTGFQVQYQRPGTTAGTYYLDGFEWTATGLNNAQNLTYPTQYGSTGNPTPTNGCPEISEPILLANDTRDGPGATIAAGDIVGGQHYVWTRHEFTGVWGAHLVLSAYSFPSPLWSTPNRPLTSPSHIFINDDLSQYTMESVGQYTRDGLAVAMEVEDAHTYIVAGMLSHNKVQQ